MPRNPSSKANGGNILSQIVESTFHLSRALRHAMECEMTDQKMNLLQFHTLLFLRENDGMTMTMLAKNLHVTSPTATSFINRLVRQHWVRRRHDTKNRKLVRLSLTPAGKTHLEGKLRDHKRVLSSVFRLLSETEQRQLLSLHQKLLSRLAR